MEGSKPRQPNTRENKDSNQEGQTRHQIFMDVTREEVKNATHLAGAAFLATTAIEIPVALNILNSLSKDGTLNINNWGQIVAVLALELGTYVFKKHAEALEKALKSKTV